MVRQRPNPATPGVAVIEKLLADVDRDAHAGLSLMLGEYSYVGQVCWENMPLLGKYAGGRIPRRSSDARGAFKCWAGMLEQCSFWGRYAGGVFLSIRSKYAGRILPCEKGMLGK